MLIPADPYFAPEPAQIAAFFDMLAESWQFELDWNIPYIHPLRVMKLLGKAEIEKAIQDSGMFPRLDSFNLKKNSEIPAAMEGISSCSVNASGNWGSEHPPIKVPKSAWPDGKENLACRVSCDLRPEPALTSNWWTNEGDNTGLLQFGDPADPIQSMGTFTHPVSSKNIEVPSAGSARFWVGFDFGEWLVPHLPHDFNLLDPALVRAMELHFGVEMAQAGRALP